MEHRLKFNRILFWDYEISEEDLKDDGVFIFYLSRILNNGCFQDIKEIPTEVIQQYLGKLHLSNRVRKFWEWYLGSEMKRENDLTKEL